MIRNTLLSVAACAGLLLVAAPAASAAPSAPTLVTGKTDSVTTVDGSGYETRIVPVDIDTPPGPWVRHSGLITVPLEYGVNSVEVRGRGECVSRDRETGEEIERGKECGPWQNWDGESPLVDQASLPAWAQHH